MNDATRRRLSQVTQRLDHNAEDDRVSSDTNRDATRKLIELSTRLVQLLPNPSLSPEERLERIARVVQDRVPRSDQLMSVVEKLYHLEARLKELIPDDKLTSLERLEQLVSRAERMSSKKTDDFVSLLKSLGDARAGIKPGG